YFADKFFLLSNKKTHLSVHIKNRKSLITQLLPSLSFMPSLGNNFPKSTLSFLQIACPFEMPIYFFFQNILLRKCFFIESFRGSMEISLPALGFLEPYKLL